MSTGGYGVSTAKQQLQEALALTMRGLGITRGDVVMLHSDAVAIAQYRGLGNESGIHLFVDTLESYLGPEGTLLMPAFTYSLTKGQVYDVRNTASDVGMITEVFRRRPESVRTHDPIFSFAIAGAHKEWYRLTESVACFGTDSVFDKLHRQNGWILWMGCAFNTTFVHFVEKRIGVSYRYDKRFQGQRILEDGRRECCECVYYVRDISRKTPANLKLLQARLSGMGLLRGFDFGRVRSWAVRSEDFLRCASAMLAERENSLIDEGVEAAVNPPSG